MFFIFVLHSTVSTPYFFALFPPVSSIFIRFFRILLQCFFAVRIFLHFSLLSPLRCLFRGNLFLWLCVWMLSARVCWWLSPLDQHRHKLTSVMLSTASIYTSNSLWEMVVTLCMSFFLTLSHHTHSTDKIELFCHFSFSFLLSNDLIGSGRTVVTTAVAAASTRRKDKWMKRLWKEKEEELECEGYKIHLKHMQSENVHTYHTFGFKRR